MQETCREVLQPLQDTVLQEMSRCMKAPVLAVTGSILAAQAAAAGSSSSSIPAILGLPGHEDVEFSVLTKSCCACNKAESHKVGRLVFYQGDHVGNQGD